MFLFRALWWLLKAPFTAGLWLLKIPFRIVWWFVKYQWARLLGGQMNLSRPGRAVAAKQPRSIAAAYQNGDFVQVVDARGATLFQKRGRLSGYTGQSLSVVSMDGGRIETYNANGSSIGSRHIPGR